VLAGCGIAGRSEPPPWWDQRS